VRRARSARYRSGMADSEQQKGSLINAAHVPAFSQSLERDLQLTVSRRLGRAPTADQLAAYRLYLYTVAEELLRRVEAELRVLPLFSLWPERQATPVEPPHPD